MLLPYSYVAVGDPAYRADVEALLEVCEAAGVAVQTIKAVARRRWPADHDGPQFSWYEPVADPAALARAVRWVLADPRVFLNTSSDARLLPAILDAAEGAGPAPDEAELRADVEGQGLEPLFDGGELERDLTAALSRRR